MCQDSRRKDCRCTCLVLIRGGAGRHQDLECMRRKKYRNRWRKWLF
jgi:hypothetical protein